MTYTCTFHSGHVAPVERVRDSGPFVTGIARNESGFKRAVFFSRNGTIHPDAWAASIQCEPLTADRAAAAYRLLELSPAPGAGVDVTG